MSLETEIQRVAGGAKDTLKAIINKLGGNIENETIDQYASKAAVISDIATENYVNTAIENAIGFAIGGGY